MPTCSAPCTVRSVMRRATTGRSRARSQRGQQFGGRLRGLALLRVALVCSSRWVWRQPHRCGRLSHRPGGRWAARCQAIPVAQRDRLLAAGAIWAPANAKTGLTSASRWAARFVCCSSLPLTCNLHEPAGIVAHSKAFPISASGHQHCCLPAMKLGRV